MKNLLLSVLAFGLLSSSAFGQEGLEKKQFTRVVGSGKKVSIGFYTSLHPDCTSRGNADIRVTKQPEHGTVETTPAINFPPTQKKATATSAMSTRLRAYSSIISRQRNTSAMMHLSYSFSSPLALLGKFITT
jgi:hypothetical protein